MTTYYIPKVHYFKLSQPNDEIENFKANVLASVDCFDKYMKSGMFIAVDSEDNQGRYFGCMAAPIFKINDEIVVNEHITLVMRDRKTYKKDTRANWSNLDKHKLYYSDLDETSTRTEGNIEDYKNMIASVAHNFKKLDFGPGTMFGIKNKDDLGWYISVIFVGSCEAPGLKSGHSIFIDENLVLVVK